MRPGKARRGGRRMPWCRGHFLTLRLGAWPCAGAGAATAAAEPSPGFSARVAASSASAFEGGAGPGNEGASSDTSRPKALALEAWIAGPAQLRDCLNITAIAQRPKADLEPTQDQPRLQKDPQMSAGSRPPINPRPRPTFQTGRRIPQQRTRSPQPMNSRAAPASRARKQRPRAAPPGAERRSNPTWPHRCRLDGRRRLDE